MGPSLTGPFLGLLNLQDDAANELDEGARLKPLSPAPSAISRLGVFPGFCV